MAQAVQNIRRLVHFPGPLKPLGIHGLLHPEVFPPNAWITGKFHLHLGNEPAGFAFAHAIRFPIDQEEHALSALDKAVDVVGHNGFPILRKRHAIGAPNVVGQKGCFIAPLRQHPLIHGGQNQGIKIQISGLQQAEHL